MPSENKVLVLMATYNGGKYIREQINSILCQTEVTPTLLVRDDGSSDHTLDIVKEYVLDDNLYYGNHDKAPKNFWELLRIASHYDDFEYFSFSDQDDIWDSDKLFEAVKTISGKTEPCLYYSSRREIDADGKLLVEKVEMSPSETLPAAMIKSNAQGCTMVFNRKLLEVAVKYLPDFERIPAYHDAFLHKLCLAIGGTVIYDEEPRLSYRIHGGNVVAKVKEHRTWIKKRIDRIHNLFIVEHSHYHSLFAAEILNGYQNHIPVVNQKTLLTFSEYRSSWELKKELLTLKEYRTGDKNADLKFLLKVMRNKA